MNTWNVFNMKSSFCPNVCCPLMFPLGFCVSEFFSTSFSFRIFFVDSMFHATKTFWQTHWKRRAESRRFSVAAENSTFSVEVQSKEDGKKKENFPSCFLLLVGVWRSTCSLDLVDALLAVEVDSGRRLEEASWTFLFNFLFIFIPRVFLLFNISSYHFSRYMSIISHGCFSWFLEVVVLKRCVQPWLIQGNIAGGTTPMTTFHLGRRIRSTNLFNERICCSKHYHCYGIFVLS